MLKPVVAAAVLAIAGSSFVYAQQRSGEPDFDGGPCSWQHPLPSVGDVRAFADARIAALKAGLQLTPEQEKNWGPFEQALRDLVKLRIDRIQARKLASSRLLPISSIDCSAAPMPWRSSAVRSNTSPRRAARSIRASTMRRNTGSRFLPVWCDRTTWLAAGGGEASQMAMITAAAVISSATARGRTG